MKADYQEIYDSIKGKSFLMTPHGLTDRVQYVEVNDTSGLSDHHSDIAQISMAIQKSKYDGSDEKFNDWVVRFGSKNPYCDIPKKASQGETNQK